jgi:hypothetical protein
MGKHHPSRSKPAVQRPSTAMLSPVAKRLALSSFILFGAALLMVLIVSLVQLSRMWFAGIFGLDCLLASAALVRLSRGIKEAELMKAQDELFKVHDDEDHKWYGI